MFRLSIRELAVGSLAAAIAICWFVEHRRLGAAKDAIAAANANTAAVQKELEYEQIVRLGAERQRNQLEDWLGKRGRSVGLVQGGEASEAWVYHSDVEPTPEQESKAIAAIKERFKDAAHTPPEEFSVFLLDDGFMAYSRDSPPAILSREYNVVHLMGSGNVAQAFEKLERANEHARMSSRESSREILRVSGESELPQLIADSTLRIAEENEIGPYPSTGIAMFDPIRVLPEPESKRGYRGAAAKPVGIIDPSLVGDYYQGNGLGFNLNLLLAEDGTFKCLSHGCVGEYGSTNGSWSREGDRIYLIRKQADGEFAETPLCDLTIVSNDGEERLLLDKDLEFRDDPRWLQLFSFGRVKDD